MLKCRASQLGSFLIASFLTACTPRAMLNASLDDYKRGYYRGSYYIVQQGDTLDYIAYVTDRDILDIINANHLTNPDRIYPGQKLNLWRKRYTAPAFGHKQKPNNLKTRSQNTSNSASEYSHPQQHRSENNVSKPRNNKGRVAYENSDEYSDKLNKSNTCVNAFGKRLQKCLQNLTWQWPTSGRVISTFSNQEYGNKGIDITGQRGQSIAASADGKVVYAGSALRGYGNLIIIKHNKNYLSAYAHNESLLVREHQIVQKGQKIATMGSSGTDSVRLHFEIRYKGNSVNPNEFLPKI